MNRIRGTIIHHCITIALQWLTRQLRYLERKKTDIYREFRRVNSASSRRVKFIVYIPEQTQQYTHWFVSIV